MNRELSGTMGITSDGSRLTEELCAINFSLSDSSGRKIDQNFPLVDLNLCSTGCHFSEFSVSMVFSTWHK